MLQIHYIRAISEGIFQSNHVKSDILMSCNGFVVVVHYHARIKQSCIEIDIFSENW